MNAFSLPFMKTALIAGLLAGNALSLIGLFVLPRGISFSGLALSQLAALGTAVGLALGLHAGGYATAIAFVAAGIFIFARLETLRRAPRDAWVAALYILAAASSVTLLAKIPNGEAHTLGIFFGNLLSLSSVEIAEAAVLFLIAVPAILSWKHRWVWIAFDPEACAVAGIKAERWSLTFLCLFAFAMTAAIHLFGVLLAFALLLLPGAGALIWSRRLKALFIIAPIAASSAVVLGLQLSFSSDAPAGPTIALLLALWTIGSGILLSFRR